MGYFEYAVRRVADLFDALTIVAALIAAFYLLPMAVFNGTDPALLAMAIVLIPFIIGGVLHRSTAASIEAEKRSG